MDYVNIISPEYIRTATMSIIRPRFKIELLDQYENAISEIIREISADNAGSISINYNQGVRRSCSFTLIDTDGTFVPDVSGDFWINRKFIIYIGLQAANDDTYWFSQGVYYVSNPSSVRDFSNKTVTINGVDKFGIFGSELGYNQLEGTYLIPADRNAATVVREILSLDTGNGYMLDPIEPLISPKLNSVLPFDIKKAPGGYMSEILKDIADIFGCNIYYDNNGRLIISDGTLDPSYSEEATIWDFTDILPEYTGANIGFDFTKVVNVVKVVGNNINDKIYEYTAENNNPLSDTNISLIGRKIKYVENPNVYNNDRAKDYAILVLGKESIVPITLNFNSSCLPHLDVNKVVSITDSYYKYQQQRFIVQSITIPISTSELMSISGANLASLPYYELQSGG